MLILLITPPYKATLFQSPDQFKGINIGAYPPLGPLYVASYIERYSDHRVKVLDAVVDNLSFEDISKGIENIQPDVVGVYSTTFTLYYSYKVVQIAKEINREIKTIIGGPQVDIFPEETLSLSDVDFVVMGEGEITAKELLDCLQGNGKPSLIKGLGYKNGKDTHLNERRPVHDVLDDLPFPARHLTPIEKYHSLIGKNKISTTVMSSRGCPWRCNFCYIQYNGKYRSRSARNVVDEVEECVKMGIKEFFFFDENFTVSKQKVIEICNEIIERDLRIIFDVRSRIDTITEEILCKLKEAGCERIQFGIESGTPEILKAMNKKISLEQVKTVLDAAKKTGITTFLDFMLGYPGEKMEQMIKTIEFAKELDPDFVQFGITALFPQTKIYKDALEDGFLKEDFWREASKNPREDIVPPLASRDYTREELESILNLAYRRFYLRPKYILKRLSKVGTFAEFRRQAKAGLYFIKSSYGKK